MDETALVDRVWLSATTGPAQAVLVAALRISEPAVASKAILAVLFLAATAPVSAHVLARAAYRAGVRGSAKRDEYAAFDRRERPGDVEAPERKPPAESDEPGPSPPR